MATEMEPDDDSVTLVATSAPTGPGTAISELGVFGEYLFSIQGVRSWWEVEQIDGASRLRVADKTEPIPGFLHRHTLTVPISGTAYGRYLAAVGDTQAGE